MTGIGPIWEELNGGLWHTTIPERYLGILQSQQILPEPAIPDAERWCTGAGPEHYPFARSLGGVSLFDFAAFDPEAYERDNPNATWQAFAPHQRRHRGAVWLELDRSEVHDNLIGKFDLTKLWNSTNSYGRNIFPNLEAAHRGPVPLLHVKRALFVDEDRVPQSITMSADDYNECEKFVRVWRARNPYLTEEEELMRMYSSIIRNSSTPQQTE